MKKINSPADLKKVRDQARAETDLRGGRKDTEVVVHMGTCGIAAGARDVLTELLTRLKVVGVQNIAIKQTGCLGLCEWEPMVTITDASGAKCSYGKLDRKKVRQIVEDHIVHGKPVENCMVNTGK